MGKHTQRMPGYLPKVAAGAAPLALLLAGPASALADPTLPLDGLPLDLQQHGSLDHSVHSSAAAVGVVRDTSVATRGLPVSAASSATQAATDTTGYGPSDSLTAVKTTNGFSQSQRHELRAGSPVRLMAGNSSRVTSSSPGSGLGAATAEGAWLPYGVDVLTDSSGDVGAGRFAGDLGDGVGVHRTSGHAVDFGGLGSLVANSEQHGTGRFVGSLDFSDVGRRHLATADVGPVSGFLLTTQSLSSNGFRGEFAAADAASARVSTGTSVSPRVGQTQSVGVTAFGTPVVPDVVFSTAPLG
ncbi:hypothetical protein [Amycolatopsis sp. DSM 110486]|uniref:hypothetical protein n=1 Tax=Amycolatopsis sp. DSM 110486 TaxID=2865832 RepID=UPI001C69BF6B|nr:hypothetical protein [Amycolatopsis sp. DSM 110486]QYN24007.1 hypothetical protein K1T34_17105 [Amycolatopsis sp. DSM 110486]